jgi:anthranilate phosphoribosyltransferase
VFARDFVVPMAEALKLLGAERAAVVHGAGGLDELSLPGEASALATQPENFVAELTDGKISSAFVSAAEAGAKGAIEADGLKGGSAAENAAALAALLAGQSADSAYERVVCLNAGAALKVAGVAKTLPEGFALAQEALHNSSAKRALDALVAITNS